MGCLSVLVNDKRSYIGIGGEVFATVQCAQLYDEVYVDLARIHALDEFVAGGHCASGCEQVVVQHHYIVGGYSVTVYFDCIGAILLLKRCANGDGGKFSGLSCRHETCSYFVSENSASYESS